MSDDGPRRLIPLGDDEIPESPRDEDEDFGIALPDECHMGGEHDVVEVRAATARAVLSRYCTRCREDV